MLKEKGGLVTRNINHINTLDTKRNPVITHNKRFAILVALVLVGLCACSKEEPVPVASVPGPAKRRSPHRSPRHRSRRSARMVTWMVSAILTTSVLKPRLVGEHRHFHHLVGALDHQVAIAITRCRRTLCPTRSTGRRRQGRTRSARGSPEESKPALHCRVRSTAIPTTPATMPTTRPCPSSARTRWRSTSHRKVYRWCDRLVTQGLGEENPIADNTTEEGRAQNRRATIVVPIAVPRCRPGKNLVRQ